MNLSIKLPFAINHQPIALYTLYSLDCLMFIERSLLFFSLVWFWFNISIYELQLLLFVGNVDIWLYIHDESHSDPDISPNWQTGKTTTEKEIYKQKTTWPMGKFAFEMQQSRLQLLFASHTHSLTMFHLLGECPFSSLSIHWEFSEAFVFC